jgi:thiol-disulfide isomerase/thioredoxin
LLGFSTLYAFGAAPTTEALLPFDANSLAALRKAHAGKPFVLAFWSVYCEPCRDEMAEWDAVKRKHPTLPIALVSTDAPADRALIDDFFKKYPPGPVQKWLFADAFSERVRYSIDKSWRGELPKSYFFDAAHRAEVKSGKVDRVWIEAWLARQTPQSR